MRNNAIPSMIMSGTAELAAYTVRPATRHALPTRGSFLRSLGSRSQSQHPRQFALPQ